ncbi:MAG: PTS sugar transporter subunit IIB [Anaerolineaceae bacterium]|nr:PTS sugar transporter subunit IIB [Anaerolineaceae bacterium]
MLKMALVCKFGASTGMLAKKIAKEAEKIDFDMSIDAYPEDRIGEILRDNDVVLVGPQLLFKLDAIKQAYPDLAYKIMVVDTVDFGTMNGAKILQDVIKRNQP